ncbi:MAG: hypothetical protein J6K43_01620 [Lachnospiraceae bacterium]|nr:hypothetical protein [Lachnospiraceae bacterium]
MQELKNVTASYSTEAVKMAIAQSTLNKTQIEAILSAKGLTGETLKTTTAELAQVTSTNALSASQAGATALERPAKNGASFNKKSLHKEVIPPADSFLSEQHI